MSDEQPRPAPRYSRFSRSDIAPRGPSAEPSLEDITGRTLASPRVTTARQNRSEPVVTVDVTSDLQPPPPPPAEPEAFAPQPRHPATPPQHVPEVVALERVVTSPDGAAFDGRLEAELLAARGGQPEIPPAVDITFSPPDMEDDEIQPEAPAFLRRDTLQLPRPDYGDKQLVARDQASIAAHPDHGDGQPSSDGAVPEVLPASAEPSSAAEAPAADAAVDAAPIRKRKPKREGPSATQRALAATQRTLAAGRAKAVPALQKSALWVAHNLQRRQLRKRYSRALIFTHNRVADRKLEKLFFVPTLKDAVHAPALDRGVYYDGPIPSAVFDWVFSAIPDDLREFSFIDFRAGRGRNLMLAARRQFDRIIGFEFDAQLFDDLQMNVAQYPRSAMVCRNIDCYRADLDGIRIPDQPSVLWFSGAWREDMIPGVMDYVRETYRQSPRRLYVVFENAGDQAILKGDDMFYRIDARISERIKLKLFSPMDFQIFRTVI